MGKKKTAPVAAPTPGTVADLIQELQRFDPTWPVQFATGHLEPGLRLAADMYTDDREALVWADLEPVPTKDGDELAGYSADYARALAEATAHHASSKTYSGKFLRPHAPKIKEIIDSLDLQTVLDYGCGKGEQYRWISHGEGASIPEGMTIEQYWGREVAKYDPAWPPYSTTPTGRFDLVLCTHVLGSIPLGDIPLFLARLFSLAVQVVYIAEKIGEVRKEVFSDDSTMPRGFSRDHWQRVIAQAWRQNHAEGGTVHTVFLATRERRPDGVHFEVRALPLEWGEGE